MSLLFQCHSAKKSNLGLEPTPTEVNQSLNRTRFMVTVGLNYCALLRLQEIYSFLVFDFSSRGLFSCKVHKGITPVFLEFIFHGSMFPEPLKCPPLS